MAKPCFDTDLLKTKIPFPPNVRAAMWKELREDYTDHGVPFPKAVRAYANSIGWHPEAIIQALADPKSSLNPRRQLGSLFSREAARSEYINTAKALIHDANKSGLNKAAAKAFDSLREAAVWGHFGVFAATHMRDSFLIPTEWHNVGAAYGKAWRLAGRDWKAYHEYEKFRMQSDPAYGIAKRAGLDVDLSKDFGISKQKRASAAFDFIKGQRLEIFKRWASDLSPEDQKNVAKVINHATGAVKYDSATVQTLMGKLLFAPKLLFGQIRAAVDPVPSMLSYLKGKNATAGERAARSFVMQRMGQLAAMQTALLGANYVAGQVFGATWAPNLTNPNKSDWLDFHVHGHTLGVSSTVNWLKFPVRAIAHGMKDADPLKSIGNDAFMQFIYHAHPTIGLGAQLAAGQDTFSRRALPMGGFLSSPSENAGKSKGKDQPTETWSEFLGQRLPIPAAAAMREFYDSMVSEGMKHQTAKAWVHAATEGAIGGATALTGFHEHADYPGEYDKPKPRKLPKTRNPGWLQQIEDKLTSKH